MLTVSAMPPQHLPPSNIDPRHSNSPHPPPSVHDYGNHYRGPSSVGSPYAGPTTPASPASSHLGYRSPPQHPLHQPRHPSDPSSRQQSGHALPNGPGPSDWEQREPMSRLKIHGDGGDMQGIETHVPRVLHEDGRIGVEPPGAWRACLVITLISQMHRGSTSRSRLSATVRLEQCGCVTGHRPSPPARRCLPCSAEQARDPNGLANGS